MANKVDNKPLKKNVKYLSCKSLKKSLKLTMENDLVQGKNMKIHTCKATFKKLKG